MFSQASLIFYYTDEIIYYGAYVDWQEEKLT